MGAVIAPPLQVGPGDGEVDLWRDDSSGGASVILAIDTSSRLGGVALCRGPAILGEETWLAGGNQTTQVLPSAQRLWERAGLQAQNIDVVVVATGPGSFTGLRVGISLAKGLAVALGIPVCGVPTLDAVAYQHRAAAPQHIAVVDAGRGKLYIAPYRRQQGALHRSGEYQALSVDGLVAQVQAADTPTLVCGELTAEIVARLRAGARVPGEGMLRLVSPAAAMRRAAFLAELGRWMLADRGAPDPAALQPVYLRGPVRPAE